jgi:hypothetical protein
MCDELYVLRGIEVSLRQKSSWDREAIWQRKQQREKELRERGEK